MIERDPVSCSSGEYDLIVVGGGIYGVSLAFESARRGLRPLLLERGDFGQGTSWNSLRIVHGGLRALQTLDLRRFYDGVGERRWFLRNFPDLVEPLPCVMPLYGAGLHRTEILRGALWANDLLSYRRNRGVPVEGQLGRGRVLDVAETIIRFPNVKRSGLRGAALWYDAVMPVPQRLLMELLRWAAACGAKALNYFEVKDLVAPEGRVEGVEAVDLESGKTVRFRARTVVNCAGPWSRQLAQGWHRDEPALFRASLAFNVLLDRPYPADSALAVTSRNGGQTFFLHPWNGKCLAGTYHAPIASENLPDHLDDDLLEAFLAELSEAVPALEVSRDAVLRVLWGCLPAVVEGSRKLAVREVMVDHGKRGGPVGLFSVSGVKFTTARRVAERTIAKIPALRHRATAVDESRQRPAPRLVPGAPEFEDLCHENPDAARSQIRSLAQEEAVVHLEDLILRRTDWGLEPATGRRIGALVAPFMGWDQSRIGVEMSALESAG